MTELMGSFVGLKIEICDEVDKMGLKWDIPKASWFDI